MLAACVFGTKNGGPGIKTTLGLPADNTNGAIAAAKSMGNEVVDTPITEVVVDEKNKIVTGPAYMKEDASPSEVFSSAKLIVDTIASSLQAAKGECV